MKMCVQAAKRNILRRTKATESPETTEPSSTNTDNTTNKYFRRGNSKFKLRKELEKRVEKNEIENSQQPSLNGGARRYERPPPPATRKFVSRRRLGGASNSSITLPVQTTTTAAPPSTRRVNRIISRRRQSSTTPTSPSTTNATEPTTKIYEDDYSLQEIVDVDAIEDTSHEERKPKSSFKSQRRPLILKESDQNPSATNEEENKRQSKKYSASIKQNQLDDLVKKTQGETTTEMKTTVEDFSPETAVAIAAHQLITAPVPVVTDIENDDIYTTKAGPTTAEYNNRDFTDNQTPTYVFEDSKLSDKSTPEYKTDYVQTTSRGLYAIDIDAPKISTYDVAKLTTFRSIASTGTEYDPSKATSPLKITGDYFSTTNSAFTRDPNDFDSTLISFLTTSDYQSDSVTKNYVRSSTFPEASTEFVSRNSAGYVPNFSTTYSNKETIEDTVLEDNLSRSRISTTLSPVLSSRQSFERTTATPRIPTAFTVKPTEAVKAGNTIGSDRGAITVTPGYGFVQRGVNRFRNEKLLPLPEQDNGYSTVGYGRSGEPSYFTREYLLESPVTKSYGENYQYLSTITTPASTPAITRRVIRKKIHRKSSTTSPRPPSPTTSVQPRKLPSRPFEKVAVTKQKKTYRPIANYDYYDDGDEKVAMKYEEGTKVVLHDNGVIECLDIGNFPHPSSCKKFISCARIDNGSLLGWEYICPKGLSFDPVGGICNWSAGLGCDEKDL